MKTEVVSRAEIRRALKTPVKATKKMDSNKMKLTDRRFFGMSAMRDTAAALEATLATDMWLGLWLAASATRRK